MNRERPKNERFLRVHFINGELLIVDVNNLNSDWRKILKEKEKIAKIECYEWTWNLQTGEIIFH
jgi:hypothetical protein